MKIVCVYAISGGSGGGIQGFIYINVKKILRLMENDLKTIGVQIFQKDANGDAYFLF